MSIHVLAGSVREPLAGARLAGKANPAERLEATVLLRRQNADAFKATVAKLAAGHRPEAFLGRADFARQFGASLVDLAAVEEFASPASSTALSRPCSAWTTGPRSARISARA